MDHFAGLDVSVKETSVCIVDDSGKSVRLARHLHFPHDPACVIHDADAGLLDRYVQTRKMVHAALLLLMLEAVHTDLVYSRA